MWEIIELHHDKKKDALRSGTAIKTAELMAEVRESTQQGAPDEEELIAGARGADFDGMRIHSVRLPGFSSSSGSHLWQSGRRIDPPS